MSRTRTPKHLAAPTIRTLFREQIARVTTTK